MNRSDLSAGGSRRRYVTVAQQLLADVGQGKYAVDAALPADRELAVTFGVSRATVREALLALEFIGVLEVRHGAGTFVRGGLAAPRRGETSFMDAPPQELIETRQTIEPLVAGLAALHVSDERLEAVRRDLDEAAELVDRPEELPRFMSLGLRFHADVATGCGNGLLAGIAGRLVDVEEHPLWTLLNQQAMSTTEARKNQLEEHRSVLDAIASRRQDAAQDAMRTHLDALNLLVLHPAHRRPDPLPDTLGR